MNGRSSLAVPLSGPDAGTFYSDAFLAPGGARHLSVQGKRTEGAGNITVTLQGGWMSSDPAVAADWVDLDLGSLIDSDALIEMQVSGLPRWNDLRVPLSIARVGNPGDEPSFNVFRGAVRLWEFSATATQELFFTCQLPHGFVKDELRPHVHFTTASTAATGTVTWGLEYTVANVNDVFGAPAAADEVDYTFDANRQYEHLLQPFTVIDASALRDSAQFICRLYRKAATDTFAGTVFGIEFDIHYQSMYGGSINAIPVPGAPPDPAPGSFLMVTYPYYRIKYETDAAADGVVYANFFGGS